MTLSLAAAWLLLLLLRGAGPGDFASPAFAELPGSAAPEAEAVAEGFMLGGYHVLPLERALGQAEELQEVLMRYPEGFFDAVERKAGGLRFLLCGGIRGPAGADPTPRALTHAGADGITLVFDASEGIAEGTVFHEVCHAADAAIGIPDGEWAALSPPGFRYYMRYADIADDGSYTPAGEAPVYFINGYAKTYPAEDRAVLFETLMRAGPGAEYLHSPHIIMKLMTYSALLRAGLDGNGEWREPFWEEKLEDVLGAES